VRAISRNWELITPFYIISSSGKLTKTETSVEKDIQKNHGNIGQLIRRAEESWRLIEALRRYVCLPER